MAISKKVRLQVYDKCGGHCAYCGREIAYKDMQVDHVVPLERGVSPIWVEKRGYQRGTDDFDNLLPSCRMCNFRKGTLTVELFRKEIENQVEGVCKTFQGRMSLAYGLIERVNKPIVFYFEKLNVHIQNTERR
jgi:hypothetical protein